MLKDRFGRIVDYLRVSVTDRCNLRCSYCMPDGITPIAMADLLSYEETAFICEQAAGLGIRRIKLTGGEPLVRKDCAVLVSLLKRIPGLEQVTMTTNGVLLGEHLEELLDAGLDAVNISLDTTDRGQYAAITGTDALDRVLASVEAAAGRLPVKINCVVLRGINEDAPVSLAALARQLPVDVRFIELMPFGAGKQYRTVPNTEVLAMLEEQYGKTAAEDRPHGNGPAVYRRPEGFTGCIGFISAVHGGFCSRCNRLRLMSTGELKPCLCYGESIPLKGILRDGGDNRAERIRAGILEAVRNKPRMHCFDRPAEITESRNMAEIGG